MRKELLQRNIQIVEKVRTLVRSNPSRLNLVEDLSNITSISLVRLHQIFKETHGETLGSFIKRTRLEYACGLMRSFKKWSCTKIAHESGFSESSDFTRTFKRIFGIPPSKWNRVSPLNLISGNTGISNNSSDDAYSFSLYPDFQSGSVEIKKFEKMHLIVTEIKNATEANNLQQGFTLLMDFLTKNKQVKPGRNIMGITYDSVLDTSAELIKFELAYPVDYGLDFEGNFFSREVPESEVATLSCRGDIKEFMSAWDYLLRGFLPDSIYKKADGPNIEIYYNDPREYDMKYWDMDLLVPITKETNLTFV